MSTGKRTLASLKDFTQAPNSRAALESLLYGDDVDYKGLRKLLKNIGEEKSDRLTQSQVTRTIERYLKSGAITLNSIRRAVGVTERDDTEDEEESEDEEEEEVVAKKKPAAKKAKSTPPAALASKSGGKKGSSSKKAAAAAAAEPERRSSGVFDFISNLFSPSKK